jgi:phosphatidylserine decarboxylase
MGLKDNERVSIRGQWELGEMAMIFVGALNVGSISLHFDSGISTNARKPNVGDYSWRKDYETKKVKDITEDKIEKVSKEILEDNKTEATNGIHIKKGSEIGMFNFGSTIVLLFTAPEGLSFNFKAGDKVKVGQAIFPANTK